MRDEILNNIDNPKQLEYLYRGNKSKFKSDFNSIYPDFSGNIIAESWNERLNYKTPEIVWGATNDLIFVLLGSFLAGLFINYPTISGVQYEFYLRNSSFIVFPILIIYFILKQNFDKTKILIIVAIMAGSFIYVNSVPRGGDVFILIWLHLPFLIWSILGVSFIGNNLSDYKKRINFIRFNAEVAVISVIIILVGILLVGFTAIIFSFSGVSMPDKFNLYLILWGLAATPIVSTYLVQTNPKLVNKVLPAIAKVFIPVVLATLVICFWVILRGSRSPIDREFLLIINILLIGVMALILFSISEISNKTTSKFFIIMLLILSILAMLINWIVLLSILFRISDGGFTPNRLAVMGSNIIILTNLLFVIYRLLRATFNSQKLENVEKTISKFLPIYTLWIIFVIFIFPFIFGF